MRFSFVSANYAAAGSFSDLMSDAKRVVSESGKRIVQPTKQDMQIQAIKDFIPELQETAGYIASIREVVGTTGVIFTDTKHQISVEINKGEVKSKVEDVEYTDEDEPVRVEMKVNGSILNKGNWGKVFGALEALQNKAKLKAYWQIDRLAEKECFSVSWLDTWRYGNKAYANNYAIIAKQVELYVQENKDEKITTVLAVMKELVNDALAYQLNGTPLPITKSEETIHM